MQNILIFVIAGVLLQEAIAGDIAKAPVPRCTRSNEVYNSCGSACPPTCDNYNTEILCTQQCVAGCFCVQGYVKNEAGNCVKPVECPKVSQPVCTGSHEIYNVCGSACPPTCDNFNGPPVPCIDVCVEGCFCEPGYVENSAGICVLPTECPVTQPLCIGAHELYDSCGSACPLTCDNYKNPPSACITLCVEGCFCEPGYVKNSANMCVLPSECPVTQPQCTRAHEKYNNCGTACPLTCDNYKNPPPCTKQCVEGCFCEAGYVKNSAGNCVLPKECPQVSQPSCTLSHQVYTTCGTACPLTCENYMNPPTFCTKQCVIGCVCEPGYVKRADGSCCQPCECKTQVMEPQKPPCKGANEVYNSCGTLCPKTCATKDIMIKCKEGCQPGCYCAAGYLRNRKNKCVKIKNCD